MPACFPRCRCTDTTLSIYYSHGDDADAVRAWLAPLLPGQALQLRQQASDPDLGQKLLWAMCDAKRRGASKARPQPWLVQIAPPATPTPRSAPRACPPLQAIPTRARLASAP